MSTTPTPKLTLDLVGSSRKSVEYTAAEKLLALQILSLVTLALGRTVAIQVPNPQEEAMTAAMMEEAAEGGSVPGLCRALFNRLVSDKFEKTDSGHIALDEKNFPKVRDWTSIGLLFRGAAQSKELKGSYTQAEIDQMFKAYWKKTDKKTA